MRKFIQYGLLVAVVIATIHSIYTGGSYTLTGLLGIVFIGSYILRDKIKEENKLLNLAFYISSIGILVTFVMRRFIG